MQNFQQDPQVIKTIFKIDKKSIKSHSKLEDGITVYGVLQEYEFFLTGDKQRCLLSNTDYSDFKRWQNHHYMCHNIWRAFFEIMDMPVNMINNLNIHEWAVYYKENMNVKNSTVNRLISNLRGMLRWGYDNGLLKNRYLSRFTLLPVKDSNLGNRRCLSPSEINRLLHTLDRREVEIRDQRDRCNKHRRQHGLPSYPEYPVLGEGYVDYVYPMIITSLYTGGRKGSIRGIKWRDINFEEDTLIFQGENAKSGHAIICPISKKLKSVLLKWKTQNNISESFADHNKYVFSDSEGEHPITATSPRCWKNILIDAKIEKFRWHDMRHTFATILLHKGIDIQTLKTLLGHSNINTTALYLHTASKHLKEAVKAMDEITTHIT